MNNFSPVVLVVITFAFYGCSTVQHGEPAVDAVAAVGNADTGTRSDYLGAVGIGVSDLARSTQFYQEILGLELLRVYELGYINENVLGYPGGEGAVLVLMHWPGDNTRRYDGSDVKNVFYVGDPKGVIERIRARGGAIDREAEPHEAVKGLLVGLGRDPDNYVVEVIQK